MDIHFNCPRCGQNLSVEERGAGMLVNCPGCKEEIEIPREAPPDPATVAALAKREPKSISLPARALLFSRLAFLPP